MTELPKQYNPKEHEEQVYKRWEDAGVFAPNEEAVKAGGEPFVIMLPPPNITGVLHMGHALQDTIMDILSRWHRMRGDAVLWLPGTDHAAIATNKVIEGQLHKEGKTRHEIGREAFIDRVEEWYSIIGPEILNQMKRLGCSCDWGRVRFTQDEGYVEAVNKAFLLYHQRGYIYRGARIVNWDPKSQTTVSDLEIDWKTEKIPFYTFQYGPFQISTARPETKFGDKYVVMHPDDERYVKYKDGDKFTAEWINGKVEATVVKDEAIDMKFGTGVMTITPWHDATDFAIAQRHKLDSEQIIDLEGKLMPIAGEFAGMSVEDARTKVVEKLKEKGLLVQVEENYEHNVALNDRGKGVIEPQIMRQWFMNMEKLRADTIKVAQEELVRFVQPRWKQHFISWMENVYDWNINRQIWLGHRLPVWWKKGTHGTDQEDGNFVVSVDQPGDDYEQDPDVLDTWFSSALWPFATLGWPEATNDLTNYYPTSVLVTGREILYLWVARMVFSGLELLKDEQYERPQMKDRIPFKSVFINPTVLTKTGQRMSKSLGTGIDPLEIIEQYGADATRFGLMYQMSYDSQAMRFDELAIASARNFANKVWNLGRFISSLPESEEESIADKWIQGRCDKTTELITRLIEEYKLGEAARAVQDFVWKDFADWYVEILKVKGSKKVALATYAKILTMLHPFMPHVTEVLWQNLGHNELLAISSWPIVSPLQGGIKGVFAKDGQDNSFGMQYFQDIVMTVRSARSLLNVPPSAVINLWVNNPVLVDALEALARVKLAPNLLPDMTKLPMSNGESIGLSSEHINSDSIDQARKKLTALATKLSEFISKVSAQLENMRAKAPEAVIQEKEKQIAESKKQLEETIKSQQLLS